MKKLILMFVLTFAVVGCGTIEKQVVKNYPKIEKKVVERVEEVLNAMVDNGTITTEEKEQLRTPLYKILIVLRDDLREEVFGTRYKEEK